MKIRVRNEWDSPIELCLDRRDLVFPVMGEGERVGFLFREIGGILLAVGQGQYSNVVAKAPTSNETPSTES